MADSVKVAEELSKFFFTLDEEYLALFNMHTHFITDLMKLNASEPFLSDKATAMFLANIPELEAKALNRQNIKEAFIEKLTGKPYKEKA